MVKQSQAPSNAHRPPSGAPVTLDYCIRVGAGFLCEEDPRPESICATLDANTEFEVEASEHSRAPGFGRLRQLSTVPACRGDPDSEAYACCGRGFRVAPFECLDASLPESSRLSVMEDWEATADEQCEVQEADPALPKPLFEPSSQPQGDRGMRRRIEDLGMTRVSEFTETLERWAGRYAVDDARKYLEEGTQYSADPFLNGVEMHGGVKYYGNLVEGIPHGQGRMIWPDGREFFGHYNMGERVSGTMHWPIDGGRQYSGQWKDGQPHGFGACFRQSGQRWKGQWIMGRPQVIGDVPDK